MREDAVAERKMRPDRRRRGKMAEEKQQIFSVEDTLAPRSTQTSKTLVEQSGSTL